LRQSAIRRRIRDTTGASDETIEETLNAARARQGLRNAVAASFVERTAAVLHKLFAAAEKKEAWACKVVLEVAQVAEAFLAGAEVTLPSAEEFGLRSAVERSVVENILSLMRGEDHEAPEEKSADE
jgi:RNA polymerase-interacting CarD/CdnL/TRCF family regulator